MFLDVADEYTIIGLKASRCRLDYESLRQLACSFIRNRYHCGVSDGGMSQQVGFEFGRCDLETLKMSLALCTGEQNDHAYFDFD